MWLSGNRVPESQSAYYTARRVEATALAGLEVRLLPLRRAETTLALTYRRSLTAAQEARRYSPGGHSFAEKDYYYWLGATLNVYLHPAAR